VAGGPRSVILRGGDGGKPDPAVLLQACPVSPACRYLFSFDAVASRQSSASAELLWVGAQGEPIDAWTVPLAEGDFPADDADPPPALRPHRRVVVPPAGSARVEVRFRVPVGVARVASASLAVSADLLVNGDLRLPLLGPDGGWSVGPETRAAVVRALPGGGTRVSGVGPGAAEVAQAVEVRAGVPLALRMEGRGAAAPDGAVPALRVTWTDAAGRETGTPAAVALHPDDFTLHALRLDPPASAARAVVSLVVPPRATVQASRLTLVPTPEVDVPIRFVASAPGELTVTEACVVYDLGVVGGAPGGVGALPADGMPPSAMPAGTGAAPGPPGASNASGAGDDCCCDDDVPAPAASGTPTPARATVPRMRAVPIATPLATAFTRWERPTLSLAGASVAAPQPTIVEEPQLPAPPVFGPEPPPPADFVADVEIPSSPELMLEAIPVIEVPGVGEVRRDRFAAVGIMSAQDLAAADPELVLRADPTLFIKTVQTLIEEAARLVTSRSV
jgi:hypothetical protein